ncbi:2,3-bisphosphoglycerate-independent phosphoglycerate mutase [bacterium]|nr:2,3-bisphosphoglycerate-independent phosphoglycerate mutase [bacterium]
MNSTNRAILMILDGWGIGKKDHSDAIFNANTPFIDHLFESAPHATLKTFGPNVGLPEGQMGNSEVGHMNIGAGRIVWQMLVRINKSLEEGSIKQEPVWRDLIHTLKVNPSKKLHLMGLVSDGGVHSSIDHLIELCAILKEQNLDDRVLIHAFTDGRDTDPHSGLSFIGQLLLSSKLGRAKLASICGRYYAMDRDKRWERTKKAYDLLVHGKGEQFYDALEAIEQAYAKGITDEFMEPVALLEPEEMKMKEDDVVLCFNFRTDRGRQITEALTQTAFHEYNMHPLNLQYYTMTRYSKSFEDIPVLFDDQDLKNTLGEHLANLGKSQVRAAETEKYPHVTFFFNGGREEPFPGEERILVHSPKVATYDLQPEMSAPELSKKVGEAIDSDKFDFICLNFANPDMVGHTGVYDSITSACEIVDALSKTLVEKARALGYSVVIIADHGNADKAENEDGSPNTAHTTNLVPCFVLCDEQIQVKDGILADVAPTLLDLMKIEPPKEMDGTSLINRS